MIRKNLLFVLALLSCGSGAFAFSPSFVKLDMQLEINGDLVSRPKTNLVLGEKGLIIQRLKNEESAYVIEITPTRGSDQQVLMAFTIKKVENGKTVLLSSPRVATLNGRAASIEEHGKDKSSLKLTVTPTL